MVVALSEHLFNAQMFTPAECSPAGENGEKNGWGRIPNNDILGEEGWCNAETPTHRCPCHLDGLGGAFCEIVSIVASFTASKFHSVRIAGPWSSATC